jgi:hypothetical protein
VIKKPELADLLAAASVPPSLRWPPHRSYGLRAGAQNPRVLDTHYETIRTAMQGVFQEPGLAARVAEGKPGYPGKR